MVNNKTMIVEYTIDETDLLIYLLYTASKSTIVKKRRKRTKVIVPIIYILLGVLFFFDDMIMSSVLFFLIGLLWFFIYPLWAKKRLIKYYKEYIKENYKHRLGRNIILEFNNDFIASRDTGGESKILTTELDEIDEIPSIIIIKQKGGLSFILPKNKITNIDDVENKLKKLANYLKIKYEINEQWK